MPAILVTRDVRGAAIGIGAVAIVIYILVPLAFLGLIGTIIWLALRQNKRRKARALAVAEGSNVHLYSNGYQTTQSTGYHPHGQQLGYTNGHNGGGWIPTNNTGSAAPAYRAMPAGDGTQPAVPQPQAAGVSTLTGQSESLSPPPAAYNQQSYSPATSYVNLAGNAQAPAGR